MMNLEENPLIAAVRTEEDLAEAILSPVHVIFLLRCNILTLAEEIKKAHAGNKVIFVHADLAEGIGNDKFGIGFIKDSGADGIISTRTNIIRFAKEWKLQTVQRFFIVDSHSIDTAIDTIRTSRPSMIEVMPGVVSKIVKKFYESVHLPVIAGGLMETKKEVLEALDAGASAISTAQKELWYA
ncbi:MAG: glycerol-3-phosphate responsive antiterminator [Oscillospiraceae bacterium]